MEMNLETVMQYVLCGGFYDDEYKCFESELEPLMNQEITKEILKKPTACMKAERSES